jgi:hypothetical protein
MILKKVISLRLTEIEYDVLKKKASSVDVSLNEFMRLIIQKYIEIYCKDEMKKKLFKT